MALAGLEDHQEEGPCLGLMARQFKAPFQEGQATCLPVGQAWDQTEDSGTWGPWVVGHRWEDLEVVQWVVLCAGHSFLVDHMVPWVKVDQWEASHAQVACGPNSQSRDQEWVQEGPWDPA